MFKKKIQENNNGDKVEEQTEIKFRVRAESDPNNEHKVVWDGLPQQLKDKMDEKFSDKEQLTRPFECLQGIIF